MKIAVIGSINTDLTVQAERIPLRGETLRGENIQYIPGGKGANQAVAMARLGAEVQMFGSVGNDENGKKMLENLKNNHVGVKHIQILPDTPTGLALITVGDHDNTIVVVAGANDQTNPAYLEQIKPALTECSLVVLQHEIPLETVYAAIDFCNQQHIPVILNPAPAYAVPLEVIEKVTFLTPNEHEARLIFGTAHTMEQLLVQYAEKLIITRGSQGVSAATKAGEVFTVSARPAAVVDTTGAGDTLNAAFAVRFANGDTLQTALQYANTAASLSTEQFGAQNGMPTDEQVCQAMNI